MSTFENFQIENLNMCPTNFLIATILLVSGAKVIQSAGIANSLIDLTHPVDNGYTLQWPTATKFQFIIGHRGFTGLSLFVYKGVSMDYRDINFNLKVDLFVYKRLEGCIDK